MPMSEKEINNNLFDQLALLERIERVLEGGSIESTKKEIDFERKLIERKLYQTPPLSDKNSGN